MVYIGDSCVMTGLGLGTGVNYASMKAYKTGLKVTELPGLSEKPLPVQTIGRKPRSRKLSRLEWMMKTCAADVISKSGTEASSERTGIIISTTKGNIGELGTSEPEEGSRVYLWNMAKNVAKALRVKTEPIVVSNACVSGVAALIVAQRLIRAGRYDDIIVIGGDEVTTFTTSGFLAFKSVSEKPCRPYDKERDGLSLGEAVAAVVVSNDKKKSRGTIIEGGGMSNDANHISGPSRTGEPLAEAIKQAMEEAQVGVDDIAFVNAHGTATVYNDEMESKAIALAGLGVKPVNSLKPYYGHTLGASGLLEAMIGVEELKEGKLLGTMGYETPGTPVEVNVSGKHREVSGSRFIKTASGFGGCNAAVVIAKESEAHRSSSIVPVVKPKRIARCRIEGGIVELNGKIEYDGRKGGEEPDFGTFVREIYHSQGDNNLKFFKMNDMCKLGYVAANYMMKGVEHGEYDMAIVMSNRSSSMDADLQHWRIVEKGEPASPAVFVYTLPNIVMGEMAIKHGIKGETIFIVDRKSGEQGREYAKVLLGSGKYGKVMNGWCDVVEGKYRFEAEIWSR